MKRLLLSLFSIGLILSFAPVRAESKMLNWTKEQLCNVQWGQGARAVAADAKAVGSLVYEQLPSKEAMKNAAVAGGSMAKQALFSGKSLLQKEPAVSWILGSMGFCATAITLAYINESYATPEQKELRPLWEIVHTVNNFERYYNYPNNTEVLRRIAFKQLLDEVNNSKADLLSSDVKQALNNLKMVINRVEYKALAPANLYLGSKGERDEFKKALEDFQVALNLEHGKIKKDGLSTSVVMGSLLPSIALMGYALTHCK